MNVQQRRIPPRRKRVRWLHGCWRHRRRLNHPRANTPARTQDKGMRHDNDWRMIPGHKQPQLRPASAALAVEGADCDSTGLGYATAHFRWRRASSKGLRNAGISTGLRCSTVVNCPTAGEAASPSPLLAPVLSAAQGNYASGAAAQIAIPFSSGSNGKAKMTASVRPQG